MARWRSVGITRRYGVWVTRQRLRLRIRNLLAGGVERQRFRNLWRDWLRQREGVIRCGRLREVEAVGGHGLVAPRAAGYRRRASVSAHNRAARLAADGMADPLRGYP